jgi:hypothetical protein
VGRLGKEWTLSGSILRLRDRFHRELSKSLGGFDGGVILGVQAQHVPENIAVRRSISFKPALSRR